MPPTAEGGIAPAISKLDSLESYRYTVKIEGNGGPLKTAAPTPGIQAVTVTGTYVRPDKAILTVKTPQGEVTQTIIGQEIWRTIGTQINGPLAVAPQSQAELTFIAAIWDRTDFGNGINCGAKEEVNGVSARKCSIDKATYQKTGEPFGGLISASTIRDPSTFSWDIWLADNGNYPVRMRANLAGKDIAAEDYSVRLELDMTNVNDKSIQVNRPQ